MAAYLLFSLLLLPCYCTVVGEQQKAHHKPPSAIIPERLILRRRLLENSPFLSFAQKWRVYKNDLELRDLYAVCASSNLNIRPTRGHIGRLNKHDGTHGRLRDTLVKQQSIAYTQHSTNKANSPDFITKTNHDENICICLKRIFIFQRNICNCLKNIFNSNDAFDSLLKAGVSYGAKISVAKSISSLKEGCDRFAQSGDVNSDSISKAEYAKQISGSSESPKGMEKQIVNSRINHRGVTIHGTLNNNSGKQSSPIQSIVKMKDMIKRNALVMGAVEGKSRNKRESTGVRNKMESNFTADEVTTTETTLINVTMTNASKEEIIENTERNASEKQHGELAYRSHTFMGLVDTRGARQFGNLGNDENRIKGSNEEEEIIKEAEIQNYVEDTSIELTTVSIEQQDITTHFEIILPDALATASVNISDNSTQNVTLKELTVTIETVIEKLGLTDSLPEWDNALASWGDAWPLYVYTIGVLSALLALYSFTVMICLFRRSYNLLSRPYFLGVHGFLLVIGVTRGLYFLIDPYNTNNIFPIAVGYLLYDITLPCLTSSFSLLFLALVHSTRMRLPAPSLIRLRVLGAFLAVHFIMTICTSVTAGCIQNAYVTRLISDIMFVIWGLVLFCGYIALFHTLLSNANHSMRIGSPVKLRPRPTINRAVKVCLITAVCGLILTGFQLYAILSVFFSKTPQPWMWWAYTLSMRIIELIICFSMAFVATQPFSLSSSCFCRNDDGKPSNGSYHNGYYNGNSPDSADGFFPTVGDETIPMARDTRDIIEGQATDNPQGGHDTLRSNTTSQRSRPMSMLVDDHGLIRFREDGDPESAAVMYSTDDELGSCADIQPHEVFYECHPVKHHSVPNTGANTPLTPRSYYSADSEGAYSEAFSFRPPSSIHLRESIDRALNYPHFTLRTPDFIETPDHLSRSNTPENLDAHNVPMSPPSSHHHRAHYDSRIYPSSQAHIHRKSSLRCILNQLSRSRASSRHNSRSDDGSTVSLRAPRHRRLSLRDDCKTAICNQTGDDV